MQIWRKRYPDKNTFGDLSVYANQRYGISVDNLPENDEFSGGCVVGFELLERIGRERGFLVSGGEINTERAAITVMDEFRNGTLGRLTLEKPKGY